MLQFTRVLQRNFVKMASKPPNLPDVQRLSPRVIRILGGNPGKFTLQGTNTFLIGTGSSRILIDTAQGFSSWKSNLSSVLSSEGCTVSTTLLTHWHGDHVLGVRDLRDICPKSTIHKFRLPVAPKYYEYPDDDFLPIVDGQKFAVEGATLRAVHCPGHTADHMGFVLEEEDDALFGGDNVLGHGTAVFEDLGTYLRSLALMKTVCGEKSRLYPSHGETIQYGCDKIEEYLAHRRQREEEISAALKAKDETSSSMEIVKIVYKNYPESLHEPAEGGVKQVLAKMLGEGKVVKDGERWRLSEKSAL